MTNDNTDRNTRDFSDSDGRISNNSVIFRYNVSGEPYEPVFMDEEIIVTVTVDGNVDSQRSKSSELDTKTETKTKEENREKEKED